jgi:hypothetical protein
LRGFERSFHHVYTTTVAVAGTQTQRAPKGCKSRRPRSRSWSGHLVPEGGQVGFGEFHIMPP